MSQTNQPKRRARSIEEIRRVEDAARELYLATGGADIDETLAPLRFTMQAYSAQMQGARELADNGMPYDPRQRTGWGPQISPYEARMTSAKMSTLIRQREQKMTQCRAAVEEGMEFERRQQAAQEASETAQSAQPEPEAPAAKPLPRAEVPGGKVLPAHAPRASAGKLSAKQLRVREQLALAG